jgi:hypothetical protein
MLSPDNMTHKQAVLGALVLALTALSDAQDQNDESGRSNRSVVESSKRLCNRYWKTGSKSLNKKRADMALGRLPQLHNWM